MSDADTLHNAASSAAPVEQKNDSADLFGGMKKKKKDKKKLDLDLDLDLDEEDNQEDTADAEQSNAAAAEDDELNFGELKKKKKSKKKVALDLDAFEKEIGENPFAQDEVDDIDAAPKDDSIEAWQGTDRDYTYQELLGRVFKTLRAQNPALSGDKKKFTMVPPQVARDGSKKTVFANVVDICKRMHRQPEHVIQFLFAELGTIGSVDGSQRLVIRGRFQPKQIENVLRRYITEYVICKTCKRPETKLTKENRIFFVTCEKCGSQRSVSAIKSGFQAQTGKRSKTRAAAGA
ncbi:putative translation initiation factor eIF2 beta subunit (isoform B) [Mycosarcoma maydis]|uniref:Translation initiation factor eIF2 beta subunit (Isoform B) n=1 Tax=Mycosarcoma maydis TaxID=5270 RepID=A0A0D1CU64_MYCMD|nr:putative translation initiation factor eIF2 beta subunit (isoform B) [Ustilago maydis 521]KIS70018.1 putative translation initiation factor eIF2 beta subunit (isoform B) [Ustilago maydis 521]|eukprot:XP_011388166.1 putative translation initiation factor eIF2 beta subunit (isoform B) [Ustilago maydis 521]